jgi:hypothetical protein
VTPDNEKFFRIDLKKLDAAVAEAIQKAILEEREACAQMLEDKSKLAVLPGCLEDAGYSQACKDMAQAIRNRSTD